LALAHDNNPNEIVFLTNTAAGLAILMCFITKLNKTTAYNAGSFS
jgi:hypothetical protein